jgi:hypothetical protein
MVVSGVTTSRAGGLQPAAIFYPHGYPMPYASVLIPVFKIMRQKMKKTINISPQILAICQHKHPSKYTKTKYANSQSPPKLQNLSLDDLVPDYNQYDKSFLPEKQREKLNYSMINLLESSLPPSGGEFFWEIFGRILEKSFREYSENVLENPLENVLENPLENLLENP